MWKCHKIFGNFLFLESNPSGSLNNRLNYFAEKFVYAKIFAIKQSWACDNFIASRHQQRDNVIEHQRPEKIQKWSSHTKYSNIAITNSFLWPENMVSLS